MARALIIAAVASALVAWGIDLQGWWQAPLDPLPAGYDATSRGLRVLRTVACAGLPWVWSPGGGDPAAIDPRDRRRLGLALGLCAVADGALVGLGAFVPGVALFFLAQLVLLRRAGEGLTAALRARPRAAGVSFGAAGLIWLGLIALLGPGLAARGLLLPVGVYGMALLASVATAALGHRIGCHPGRAGRLMVGGMVLFALCDVLVGLGAAMPSDAIARLGRLHTGWFYTPALILLAASVRRMPAITPPGPAP